MLYTAVHHVTIQGEYYFPGEVFEAKLQKDQEERMLRLGALKKLGTQPEETLEEAPEELAEGEEGDMEIPPEIDVSAGITGKKKSSRRTKA